ncbi:MAG: serine/threonine protein kinase, partial [Terracidiphilus sp.]
MKTCPQCDTGYPDSQTACPVHGHLLNEIRELKPGMVIHKTYRIIRKLGQGGMGTVYLAQHIQMDEPRALKFLSPELSRDQAFTARFQREVRTLRQIRNRNVVDCGDLEAAEDDSLFFSMEFVDGPDLRAFLRDYHSDQASESWVPPVPRIWGPGIPPLAGSLPVPLALSIARQIAEGL